jgi:hypothetical protein
MICFDQLKEGNKKKSKLHTLLGKGENMKKETIL